MKNWEIIVKRVGTRRYGVFGRIVDDSSKPDDLISVHDSRAEALDARAQVERDCLDTEVENAERAAGWDRNP